MGPALFAALLTIAEPAAAEPATAFDQLKALVGTWEATATKTKVTYKLISNDSVLVQSYMTASGKETLTVFHADGGRLIATHYCAQGNQPRLQLDPRATNKEKNAFVFTFLDATNLPKPEASHLVRFELRLGKSGTHQQLDTYEKNGKSETTTLDFKRTAHGPEPM
jgi:hypothetical protein